MQDEDTHVAMFALFTGTVKYKEANVRKKCRDLLVRMALGILSSGAFCLWNSDLIRHRTIALLS